MTVPYLNKKKTHHGYIYDDGNQSNSKRTNNKVR